MTAGEVQRVTGQEHENPLERIGSWLGAFGYAARNIMMMPAGKPVERGINALENIADFLSGTLTLYPITGWNPLRLAKDREERPEFSELAEAYGARMPAHGTWGRVGYDIIGGLLTDPLVWLSAPASAPVKTAQAFARVADTGAAGARIGALRNLLEFLPGAMRQMPRGKRIISAAEATEQAALNARFLKFTAQGGRPGSTIGEYAKVREAVEKAGQIMSPVDYRDIMAVARTRAANIPAGPARESYLRSVSGGMFRERAMPRTAATREQGLIRAANRKASANILRGMPGATWEEKVAAAGAQGLLPAGGLRLRLFQEVPMKARGVELGIWLAVKNISFPGLAFKALLKWNPKAAAAVASTTTELGKGLKQTFNKLLGKAPQLKAIVTEMEGQEARMGAIAQSVYDDVFAGFTEAERIAMGEVYVWGGPAEEIMARFTAANPGITGERLALVNRGFMTFRNAMGDVGVKTPIGNLPGIFTDMRELGYFPQFFLQEAPHYIPWQVSDEVAAAIYAARQMDAVQAGLYDRVYKGIQEAFTLARKNRDWPGYMKSIRALIKKEKLGIPDDFPDIVKLDIGDLFLRRMQGHAKESTKLRALRRAAQVEPEIEAATAAAGKAVAADEAAAKADDVPEKVWVDEAEQAAREGLPPPGGGAAAVEPAPVPTPAAPVPAAAGAPPAIYRPMVVEPSPVRKLLATMGKAPIKTERKYYRHLPATFRDVVIKKEPRRILLPMEHTRKLEWTEIIQDPPRALPEAARRIMETRLAQVGAVSKTITVPVARSAVVKTAKEAKAWFLEDLASQVDQGAIHKNVANVVASVANVMDESLFFAHRPIQIRFFEGMEPYLKAGLARLKGPQLRQFEKSLRRSRGFYKETDNLIAIMLGKQTPGTIPHEFAHAAWRSMLLPEEKAVVAGDFFLLGKGSKEVFFAKNPNEYFARAFEDWMVRAVAHSPRMQNIFRRVWDGLTDIFRTLMKTPAIKVSDDVAELFKRVAPGMREEIAAHQRWKFGFWIPEAPPATPRPLAVRFGREPGLIFSDEASGKANVVQDIVDLARAGKGVAVTDEVERLLAAGDDQSLMALAGELSRHEGLGDAAFNIAEIIEESGKPGVALMFRDPVTIFVRAVELSGENTSRARDLAIVAARKFRNMGLADEADEVEKFVAKAIEEAGPPPAAAAPPPAVAEVPSPVAAGAPRARFDRVDLEAMTENQVNRTAGELGIFIEKGDTKEILIRRILTEQKEEAAQAATAKIRAETGLEPEKVVEEIVGEAKFEEGVTVPGEAVTAGAKARLEAEPEYIELWEGMFAKAAKGREGRRRATQAILAHAEDAGHEEIATIARQLEKVLRSKKAKATWEPEADRLTKELGELLQEGRVPPARTVEEKLASLFDDFATEEQAASVAEKAAPPTATEITALKKDLARRREPAPRVEPKAPPGPKEKPPSGEAPPPRYKPLVKFESKEYEDEVYKLLERLPGRKGIWRDMAGINQIIRSSLTVGTMGIPFPAFHVRNMFSTMFQTLFDPQVGPAVALRTNMAILADLPVIRALGFSNRSQVIRFYRAVAGDASALKGLPNIGTYAPEEIVDFLTRFGVVSQDFASIEIAILNAGKMGTSKLLDYAKGAGLPRNMARKVESSHRIAAFVKLLGEGVPPPEAADRVGRIFVKYNYQSVADRLIRDLFPFSRFTIATVPVALAEGMRRPYTILPFTKFQASAKTEETTIPPWVREGLAMPMGMGPGGPMYLSGLGTVTEELNILGSGQGIARTLEKGVLGRLHPFIKTPLEAVTRRQFYFGQPLGDYRAYPDLPIAGEQIIGMSPLSRMANTVRKFFDTRKPFWARLLNTTTGIRIVSVDEERELRKLLERYFTERARSDTNLGAFTNFYVRGDVDPELRALLDRWKQTRAK